MTSTKELHTRSDSDWHSTLARWPRLPHSATPRPAPPRPSLQRSRNLTVFNTLISRVLSDGINYYNPTVLPLVENNTTLNIQLPVTTPAGSHGVLGRDNETWRDRCLVRTSAHHSLYVTSQLFTDVLKVNVVCLDLTFFCHQDILMSSSTAGQRKRKAVVLILPLHAWWAARLWRVTQDYVTVCMTSFREELTPLPDDSLC